MNFQSIVVTIAIITLIVLLTFIGFAMQNERANAVFPPVSSECPDYWQAKDGKCVNVKNLGNCATGENNTVNFNTRHFEGDDALCVKAQWARRCGVTWNGITNAGSQLQEKCNQN